MSSYLCAMCYKKVYDANDVTERRARCLLSKVNLPQENQENKMARVNGSALAHRILKQMDQLKTNLYAW